jgi:hypothetical protein
MAPLVLLDQMEPLEHLVNKAQQVMLDQWVNQEPMVSRVRMVRTEQRDHPARLGQAELQVLKAHQELQVPQEVLVTLDHRAIPDK